MTLIYQLCCLCAQLLSRVWLSVTPRTVACQASPSMGFPRHKYWNELHFHLQGILPTQGSFKSTSPAWQADSLPLSHLGSPYQFCIAVWIITLFIYPWHLFCHPLTCHFKLIAWDLSVSIFHVVIPLWYLWFEKVLVYFNCYFNFWIYRGWMLGTRGVLFMASVLFFQV